MDIIKLKSPLTIELTLTELCNHKCIHCYNPWREHVQGLSTLSYEQIDIICEELKNNEVQYVTITGGEPTIKYELLKYVIGKFNDLGIGFGLNSNITALNSNQIAELKRLGVRHILTSLPSLSEPLFEEITQTRGSYYRLLNNLSFCNKEGINITVNMVITRKNFHELGEIKSFVKSHNIKGITISLSIPPVYDADNEIYRLDNTAIIRIADTLLELRKELGIYVNSLTPLPLCILKDINKYEDLISTTCSAGISVCTINSNGDIQACAHDEKIYGNIFKEGLKTCWERMEDRRHNDSLPNECRKCKYVVICGGECRILSEVSNKKYQIDSSADIKFIPACAPKIDFDTKYTVNTDVIIRKEDFGACVNVNFDNYFISHNLLSLYDIMCNLNTFSLNSLLDYIEINENLLPTIYHMEYIGLINKM